MQLTDYIVCLAYLATLSVSFEHIRTPDAAGYLQGNRGDHLAGRCIHSLTLDLWHQRRRLIIRSPDEGRKVAGPTWPLMFPGPVSWHLKPLKQKVYPPGTCSFTDALYAGPGSHHLV